jgi:hypothetical protein
MCLLWTYGQSFHNPVREGLPTVRKIPKTLRLRRTTRDQALVSQDSEVQAALQSTRLLSIAERSFLRTSSASFISEWRTQDAI